jgi:hypothetical protein
LYKCCDIGSPSWVEINCLHAAQLSALLIRWSTENPFPVFISRPQRSHPISSYARLVSNLRKSGRYLKVCNQHVNSHRICRSQRTYRPPRRAYRLRSRLRSRRTANPLRAHETPESRSYTTISYQIGREVSVGSFCED